VKKMMLGISVMERISFDEDSIVIVVVLDQLEKMILQLYQYPQP
jgi:hypothetical protein